MKPHPYSRGRYDPLGPSTQLRGDRDLVGARNRPLQTTPRWVGPGQVTSRRIVSSEPMPARTAA